MRPECVWSMSTVGLTAQEISFPIENPFLRGCYCHSMAGSKPSWGQRHELDNSFYFSVNYANTDYSYQVQQTGPPPSYERHKHSPSSQRLPPKKSRPSFIPLFCSTDSSSPSPVDNDQVVPPFQKLSVHECSSPPQTPGRCSKPLPPIPRQKDVSPVDSEVEFFTSSDESCSLVSDQCSKSSSFRYGVYSRRSFRDCGQINHAYYDGPVAPLSTNHHHHHHHHHPHHQVPAQQDVRGQCVEQQQPPEPAVRQNQQEKTQRRLRRSHSGPAGSLHKPSLLRLTCSQRHTDKAAVPPPIPPRLTQKTTDCRRWSAEVSSGAYSDDDKPPKLPPRDHMSRGSSRTPSPKSLPTYINGVMPPTQSFAPDPKYVSGRSLQRQNSEGSPCIHPIMEDGKKASATHYYLMPQQSPFEAPCDCHTRRKEHVHLV